MKKYISIFLFTFLFTFLFSFNCFANDYTDLIVNENESSMYNILASYDIISGFPNGNFMPNRCITRAQMAKIAIVLKGYKDYTNDIKSNFSDMNNHWAEKYVEFSNILHLVEGYDDNTFRPDDFVLYNEAVKIILKVIGYDDENVVDENIINKNIKNNNSYANNKGYNNYILKARKLGILDNIYNESIYMTRRDIAKIIYNSLNCKLLYNKNTTSNENETLFDNIGVFKRIKITDEFALNHKEYNLSKYILNTCDVYFDKYDNIVYVENPLYTTTSKHINKILNNNYIVIEDEYKNIRIHKMYNVPIVYNGIRSNTQRELLENSDAIFLLGRNKNIISAVIEKVTKTVIVKNSDIYNGENTFIGSYLPLKKDKPDFDNIIVNGAVDNLYDIKENDVVYFKETLEDYDCKSIINLEVIRNNFEGIFYGINMIEHKSSYILDNKLYKVSKNNEIKEVPSIGDKVLIILDKNGEIIDVKIIKYAKKPSSFGVILNINDESSKLPSVKIIDSSGKINTFNLKENCGCVIKSTNKNSIIYTTSLSKDDIILYYVENGIIKIIEKQQHINIKSLYDANNRILIKNNFKVNNNSIILKNNKLMNINKLGYYIEGKAIVVDNKVLIINISKNLLNNEQDQEQEQVPIVQQKQKYTGNIIGAISKIKTDNGENKILLFNSNTYFKLKKDYNLKNYVNSLIKVCIKDDEIIEIIKYKPEITKSTITNLYNLQIKIDNTSFVEYSSNTLVFSCKYDKNGNLTKFVNKKISDLKIGNVVQFFQTESNYNGVMNVIIILE